jgi:predicted DNA binding CopG/RHH family protein
MTIHNHDLNKEDTELLAAYENGELRSVPDLDERKKELRAAVQDTSNKTRNINIRLSEKVLSRLKAKALEEGLPYQTLVSSILYKAASGYPVKDPVPHYPTFAIEPGPSGLQTVRRIPNE